MVTKTTMKSLLAATAFGALIPAAFAAPSIEITEVRQRWPWNNKVDITYSVSEGQDVANGLYAKVEFTVTVGGNATVIDGNTLGASASDGTHTVTWNAPAGLRATDATMTAALVATNVPSGNDYMIIDLVNGGVWFEGLMGVGETGQTASNVRYNTDEYKDSKMVLRKIPKWADRASLPNAASLPSGGYPTGNTGNSSNDNLTYRQSKRDYYIGVFMVTEKQYRRYASYSANSTKPVGWVTWHALRGDTPPTNALAKVASDTGTFLQRLVYLAGNKYAFDLPTFLMSELAVRAGGMNAGKTNTLTYWYGDTADAAYCNTTGSRQVVGNYPANPWGLYDACGNGLEWVLDDAYDKMQQLDLFVPRCNGTTKRVKRNGAAASQTSASNEMYKATSNETNTTDESHESCGFRVAVVVD